MSPEDKKRILHRRHIIVLVIALVIITLLQLWTFVIGFGICILVLGAIMWFIDWVTGADLDGHPDDDQLSDEEKTMWDIFTLNQLFNHHDDNHLN